MTLLIAMTPFYIFGNLHCLGMCGPLVMMIGAHRYRLFYFFGRLLSFTLAGMIAGEIGAVLNFVLNQYYLPAATSFFFGGVILIAGIYSLIGWPLPGHLMFGRAIALKTQKLSLLMLRDQPLSTFLFGFFTILLPCGQTLIVFSACALSGDLWVGALNGFCFALLTSPSLFFAMHAHALLTRTKKYYNEIMGASAIIIGGLSICRGMAELEIIPHLSIAISSEIHPFLIF